MVQNHPKFGGVSSLDEQQGIAEVNGTRLYYEIAGSGHPLVLIHGFAIDDHRAPGVFWTRLDTLHAPGKLIVRGRPVCKERTR